MTAKTTKGHTKGVAMSATYSTSRYLLMGGLLGLYFGWFFRPAREPSLIFAVGLSLFIAFALFIFRLFKKDRPSLSKLLLQLPLNIVQYTVILSVLEARHFAMDWGGRAAVIVLTVVMGILCGYWLSFRENRVSF